MHFVVFNPFATAAVLISGSVTAVILIGLKGSLILMENVEKHSI